MSTEIDWEPLLAEARAVRSRAHAPYSEYMVGSAVLTRGGIFRGCNVENVTFGLTICAERSALVNMVACGELEPLAVMVVTPGPPVGMPCGMCRQSLAEFVEDVPIRVACPEGDFFVETSLLDLLPKAFRPIALAEVKKK